MDKILLSAKVGLSSVLGVIVAAFGGYDKALEFLITLMIADIVTGLILAIRNKTISSAKMRDGIMRKALYFLVLVIAVKADACLANTGIVGVELVGSKFCIRTFFLVLFILDETISLIENLGNLGVPMPKWITDVLVQISDSVNKSTSRAVLSWVKKTFGKSDKDRSEQETEQQPEQSIELTDIETVKPLPKDDAEE